MRTTLLLGCLPLAAALWAQPAINGPMPGHVDMMEANIWLQCKGPCQVELAYWPESSPDSITVLPSQRSDARDAHAMTITIGGLQPGRTYRYQVAVNGMTLPYSEPLRFTTQKLWKFRTDPPAFRVAMGSCAYVNEPDHDRPGRAYGGEYGIFDAIADQRPDIMLWLGDNVYLREPDWGSRSGYLHRYTHARSTPELQRLLRSTKHYAIWDDHDFGPNDADGSWVHSAMAREAFGLFWANPTLGVPGAEASTATAFSHNDVDFFLLDNRTYRVRGDMRTAAGAMLGNAQLDWLSRALKYSDASFKLVVVGSQVLNTAAVWETYATMPGERAELIRRIEEEGIEGVVFLTGDRHFTELSELRLKDGRVLYDLTVSPLTSGPHVPKEENRNRVEGTMIAERNFAVLEFDGKRNERIMRIRVYDAQGEARWERSIQQPRK